MPADYEIHFHRADGTLAIVIRIAAADVAGARAQAQGMLRDGLSTAHIWRDGAVVDSVYAFD